MIRSEIIGCGSYLPERVVTNAELSAKLDTTDEWITSRTGIRQRHLAADGELTSDLALKAAERALEAAGVSAAEVDMVVLATSTPDLTFPSTATKVQYRPGMAYGAAFAIQDRKCVSQGSNVYYVFFHITKKKNYSNYSLRTPPSHS